MRRDQQIAALQHGQLPRQGHINRPGCLRNRAGEGVDSARVKLVEVRSASVSLPTRQNRATGYRSARALRMRCHEANDG